MVFIFIVSTCVFNLDKVLASVHLLHMLWFIKRLLTIMSTYHCHCVIPVVYLARVVCGV